jgi:electron transport complex protein RnfC
MHRPNVAENDRNGWRGFEPVLSASSDASSASEGFPITDLEGLRKWLAGITADQIKNWLDRLIDSGINADRWSSPDLISQLRQLGGKEKPAVTTIVCSALDLDPALPVQSAFVQHNAATVVAGAVAVTKIAKAGSTLLAVPETVHGHGARAIRQAAKAAGIRCIFVENDYPLAHPSILLQRLLKLRVPPETLPTRVGVVMLDAVAAGLVANQLVQDRPASQVPVGIYDQAKRRAHLMSVPVATTIGQLCTSAGIATDNCDVRAGHILRNLPVPMDHVVGKHELTFLVAPQHLSALASACLRCGWCIQACPARVHPAALLDAAQQNDRTLAAEAGLKSCIDCGICSHVCPSGLPLLEAIRGLRL